jgi:hypothetical protein
MNSEPLKTRRDPLPAFWQGSRREHWMGSVQLSKRRGAGGLMGARAPHRPIRIAQFGVIVRYVLAVPFLAVGAALLTIGALIAGTSSPPRKSGGRAQRDPANDQYRC